MKKIVSLVHSRPMLVIILFGFLFAATACNKPSVGTAKEAKKEMKYEVLNTEDGGVGIYRYYDDEAKVTCWVVRETYGGSGGGSVGISCTYTAIR